MAKVRVYELAKELGVESKTVLSMLKDMGEFVRSASSTVEAPVERRLKGGRFGAGSTRAGSVRGGCRSPRSETASRTSGAFGTSKSARSPAAADAGSATKCAAGSRPGRARCPGR